MEQKSIEHVTTIVLKLAGVLTALVGLILTTHVIVQLIAAHSATSAFPQGLPPGMNIDIKGAAGRIGAWAIVGQLTIVVWGVLLMAGARSIAQMITKE